MTDNVNHPPHYNQGNIECLDAIESALTESEYIGHLKANILKYIWRLNLKGEPIENAEKANFYLSRLIYKLGDENFIAYVKRRDANG